MSSATIYPNTMTQSVGCLEMGARPLGGCVSACLHMRNTLACGELATSSRPESPISRGCKRIKAGRHPTPGLNQPRFNQAHPLQAKQAPDEP